MRTFAELVNDQQGPRRCATKSQRDLANVNHESGARLSICNNQRRFGKLGAQHPHLEGGFFRL